MAKKRGYDKAEAPEPTSGNGHPLLKMDHVVATGTPAVLTGELSEYESEFGPGFYFGVRVEGKLYDFRVREDSGNFGILKRLAPKTAQLRGTKIKIGIKEFKGRDYLAIL